MSDARNLGVKGESIAVDYLTNNGYKILDRNWKSGRTEIDIIAENERYVVFVEVKTRSEDFQVDPVYAVNVEKQRTIIFAADNYLRRKEIDKECRFDIITIIKKGGSFSINHIEEAFYPTL